MYLKPSLPSSSLMLIQREVPYICVVFHFHKETTALQVAIKPYSCMLTESSKQKCLRTKIVSYNE